METIIFKPTGIFVQKIEIAVDGTKITGFKREGGCQGNRIWLSLAIKGMEYQEVIQKGRYLWKQRASCPVQLAQALRENFE